MFIQHNMMYGVSTAKASHCNQSMAEQLRKHALAFPSVNAQVCTLTPASFINLDINHTCFRILSTLSFTRPTGKSGVRSISFPPPKLRPHHTISSACLLLVLLPLGPRISPFSGIQPPKCKVQRRGRSSAWQRLGPCLFALKKFYLLPPRLLLSFSQQHLFAVVSRPLSADKDL